MDFDQHWSEQVKHLTAKQTSVLEAILISFPK